jgi:hypothetical protein
MSYLVATRWVLFPNLLSLVSCSKFMQLNEKMVEICPIWWPLDVFWPPFVYLLSPKLKSKVRNELNMCFSFSLKIISYLCL